MALAVGQDAAPTLERPQAHLADRRYVSVRLATFAAITAARAAMTALYTCLPAEPVVVATESKVR